MKKSSIETLLLILSLAALQVSCQLQTSDYELFQVFEEALVKSKSNIFALQKFYYPPESLQTSAAYISVSISVNSITNATTSVYDGAFYYNGSQYLLSPSRFYYNGSQYSDRSEYQGQLISAYQIIQSRIYSITFSMKM